MISTVLIANRGEIAVRIARTAHRLGLGTVGVFSEPDADSLHTRCVDLAVGLGGATPAESYLRMDAVLDAAVRTGCDAVHPGYGFLAENAVFARAVTDAGLTWVGPTPEQIELLGDKVAAKSAAVTAGVPTTSATVVTATSFPADLPMPALIKAAAGGGGRGMRVVTDAADMADAIAAASREATSAFGDGTVFVEPYLERGRHIEVQVVGDHHGNVIHLGERECSIQRRNQKVMEEAPSAGIDPATREALCAGALALARHVGYHGAGTVEFLVADDPAGGPAVINFLEVNTRLQVEHPVTEAVTGLDLVELQLLVAAGEPLPLTQDQVRFSGHAIEARLVAEDPAAGWLPSTGRIERFAVDDSVRVDAGVAAGSTVSSDYDSLLAKVIAHAPTRAAAAATLARALRTARLSGVRTDADCLVALLGEADFLDAATPTAYLSEHPAVEAARGPGGDDRVALLLAAVFATQTSQRAADSRWGFAPSGWRNVAVQGQRRRWVDDADGTEHRVEYRRAGGGAAGVAGGADRFEVRLGAWPEPGEDGALGADERRVAHVRVQRDDGVVTAVEIDGVVRQVEVGARPDGALSVWSAAGGATWVPVPRFVDHDASEAGAGPVSPLPGSVISVHVTVGDKVADGDLLVVVEAMKMEHRIVARADAVVTEVCVAPGDRVDAGDILVLLGEG